MTFDQIRFFLEVAYCSSFSLASKRLYVSQPNLTKAIASMEKEIGVKLFDRTTRKVVLTEAGERLLVQAETMFMPFQRSFDDLCSSVRSNQRSVNIGLAIGESLPPMLEEILIQCNLAADGSRYFILHNTHSALGTNLMNHRYDLVISSDRGLRSIVGTSFLKIQPFQMVLAISKKHPLGQKEDLQPADLREEIVFFSVPRGTTNFAEVTQSLCYRIGGAVKVKMMEHPIDALQSAQLCAGAAIIPALVQKGNYPDLLFLPFKDHRDSEPVAAQAIVWRTNETSSQVLDLIEKIRPYAIQ